MKTHHPTSLPRPIPGSESRRNRITRFGPILLSLLVGAAGFVATRGVTGKGTASGEGHLEHRELAELVQAAAERSPAATTAAWIYRGQQVPAGRRARVAPESGAAAVRRLERRFQGESGAELLHGTALLALLGAWEKPEPDGQALARAERELARSLAEDGERAGAFSDLAALYLTWAAQLKRPRLYLDAYAASRAARALEPELPEARFNQALALEQLGLFQEAAGALDGGWPDWAEPEAIAVRRERLAATDPVSLHERFARALAEAADEGDLRSFLETAELAPPAAQRFAEEVLLPRWAASQEAGDGERARSWLEMARALGGRLAEPPGSAARADAMLRDTSSAIDGGAGDRRRLASLLRGHRAYGRGMAAFPERPAEARKHFEEAELALAAGGTPFVAWARFYVAACRHIQRDLSGAMAVFDELGGSCERYPGLEVRRGWGRGLIFNQLHLAPAALAAYRPARGLAAALGDEESAAAIGYQEAEASVTLGNAEEAWRSLAVALQVGDFPTRARYRVSVLFTAVDQVLPPRPDLPEELRPALEPGLAELRELFRRHAVEDAERSGSAMFVAQTRNRSAVYLETEGRREAAEYQRRRAKEGLARVPDADFRRRLEAEFALGAAAAGESSEELLRASLETFRQQNLPLRVVETALALAEDARRRGEPEQRERWLKEAQRVVEILAGGLEPVRDRYRYLAATRQAFRARLVAALEGAGGAERALGLYLREQELQRRALANAGEAAAERRSEDAGISPLPAGRAFVAWLALPDGRLLALVLGADGVRARPLAIGAARLAEEGLALRSRIAALNDSRQERFVREADGALRELSRQLVEPIADLLPPAGGTLGLSLDDAFAGIPFEALFAAGGERLAERFTIARVAGPEPLLRSPRPLPRPEQGALAVGADRPAASWGLESLEGVRLEIARLKSQLRLQDAQVLAGEESRRGRVLERLAGARWLHFAGHALADPYDPTSSLLILAEDGGGATSLSIEDLAAAARGRLELAVLAGCDTARSGTGGLAQALERGGVPVVIGSQWPVNDEGTAQFFIELYRLLAADVPPVQALHETRLAALRSNDPRLASVATWGAFAAWGW